MRQIYCTLFEDGIETKLEVLSFIDVAQYHPYPERAVCVDDYGNVTTPSIKQIKILKPRES